MAVSRTDDCFETTRIRGMTFAKFSRRETMCRRVYAGNRLVNRLSHFSPRLLLVYLLQTHAEDTASLSNGIDTFYLIFAGALVYFMQTGL